MLSPWQRGLARSRSRLTSSGFRNTCVGGLTTPAPTAACASASDAAHQTQSPLGMRSTCVASSLRHSTPRPFECPAIARGKALVAPQNQACLPLRAPSAEPSDASRVPETPSTDAKCAGCACASAVTFLRCPSVKCVCMQHCSSAPSRALQYVRPQPLLDVRVPHPSAPIACSLACLKLLATDPECPGPARTRCTLNMDARARGVRRDLPVRLSRLSRAMCAW